MTRKILIISMMASVLLTACNQQSKQENTNTTKTETTTASNDVITQSLTDKDGNTLDMSFDNANGTATLNFKEETIELDQQRAASGIWYKNEQHELRGKGDHYELKKDGKTVFEN